MANQIHKGLLAQIAAFKGPVGLNVRNLTKIKIMVTVVTSVRVVTAVPAVPAVRVVTAVPAFPTALNVQSTPIVQINIRIIIISLIISINVNLVYSVFFPEKNK